VGISINITGITTGDKHSCALLENGTIMCWGDNNFGQLGINSTTSSPNPELSNINPTENIVGITSGSDHTCAAINDGTLYCWGDNSDGQIGDGTTTTRLTPTSTTLSGELIHFEDRDIDGDLIFNIFDTHAPGDEDGDGVPTPEDQFPHNPARAVFCDAGQYGRYICELSTPGHFVATAGQLSEYPCDYGTYQPASNQSSCIDSDPGNHVDVIGAISQDSCIVGTFQPLSTQQHCVDASPGNYVDSVASTNQTPCDIGEYQPLSGQTTLVMVRTIVPLACLLTLGIMLIPVVPHLKPPHHLVTMLIPLAQHLKLLVWPGHTIPMLVLTTVLRAYQPILEIMLINQECHLKLQHHLVTM
jgi:hypothetical protein